MGWALRRQFRVPESLPPPLFSIVFEKAGRSGLRVVGRVLEMIEGGSEYRVSSVELDADAGSFQNAASG
jgi:hypothetical protein